jgi:hypothetical protein
MLQLRGPARRKSKGAVPSPQQPEISFAIGEFLVRFWAEEEYNRRKKQRQQCPACRNRNQVNARSPKSLEADKSGPGEDTDYPSRDDQKERHTEQSISC